LCTRFSSVLYNSHRFSLHLCVGVVILLIDTTIWSSILFTVDISFSCLTLTHDKLFFAYLFPDNLPPCPTALQTFTVHTQSYLISLVQPSFNSTFMMRCQTISLFFPVSSCVSSFFLRIYTWTYCIYFIFCNVVVYVLLQ